VYQSEPRVDVGPRLQDGLHQIEVTDLLLHVGGWLRMPRLRRPLHVQHAVERRGAAIACDSNVRPAVEQPPCEIEMAVDRRHQDRAGVIAGAHLVDSGPGVDQRERGVAVAVPCGEQQGGEATVDADQVGIAERLGLVA
jgi:hypothetical protein